MKQTYIENVSKHEGQEITIKGWLQNKRSSGKIQFLIVRDGTGIDSRSNQRIICFSGSLSAIRTYYTGKRNHCSWQSAR